MLDEITEDSLSYCVQATDLFDSGVTDKQQVRFCAFVLLLHERPIKVVEELHTPPEHCHTCKLGLWN